MINENMLEDLRIRRCSICTTPATYSLKKIKEKNPSNKTLYLCENHMKKRNKKFWKSAFCGIHTRTGRYTVDEAERELSYLIDKHIKMYNPLNGLKCQVILDNWNKSKWAFFGKITHDKKNYFKLKGDWVLVPVETIKEIHYKTKKLHEV